MACDKNTHRCRGVHRCCHENLLELLDFTIGIFNKHSIPYWLAYGTLLGAVRNHKFIPWDDDIDIGMLMQTARRLLPMCMEFVKAGYGLRISTVPDGRICTIGLYYSFINELHVDVDISITGHDDAGLISKGVEFPGCISRLEDVLEANLIEIEFEGKTYKIPRNPEYMLEKFYGSGWRIPKAKKWIKDRVLADPEVEPRIIIALENIGEYKKEPGRDVKE